MKTLIGSKNGRRGAAIVELLGTVCIVSLLACMLAPAIMNMLHYARLTATIQNVQNMRGAATQYFKSYGKFGMKAGASITWTNRAHDYWDREVLAKEQFIERMLSSRIATDAYLRLVQVTNDPQGDVIFDNLGVGHLGSVYCNNGMYDLTQEYSVHRRSQGWLYARTRPAAHPRHSGRAHGGGGRAAAQASLMTGGLDELTGDHFFGAVEWRGLRRNLWGPVGRALASLASLVQPAWDSGLGPLQSCYPATTPPPPPAPGNGTGSVPEWGTGNRPAMNNSVHDGAVLVEVVLEGVKLEDAFRLSMAIDGKRQSNWAYWDSVGRVKYDFVSSPTGVVYIYLAHH